VEIRLDPQRPGEEFPVVQHGNDDPETGADPEAFQSGMVEFGQDDFRLKEHFHGARKSPDRVDDEELDLRHEPVGGEGIIDGDDLPAEPCSDRAFRAAGILIENRRRDGLKKGPAHIFEKRPFDFLPEGESGKPDDSQGQNEDSCRLISWR